MEVELPCKPGNVTRRPCFCAPYHFRLDWNIWFLGFKPHRSMLEQRERWLYALLAQLLRGESTLHPLLDEASVSALGVGGLPARLSVALAPRLFTLPTLRPSPPPS